ncbi:MAG TPA: exopolysaccharide biosynthesis polyprenyl glycosylphosphotransferase [Chitinophagaceae bacterium]|nr:exopolysaccharide biosynthesis polyprenyl glycosylphosphotransferase [Chitinophagaceae bacterium]
MSTSTSNYHSFSFAVYDFIAINLTYFLLKNQILQVNLKPYLILGVVINISWVICSYLFRLYIGRYSNSTFFKKTVQTYFLFIVFILSFIFLYHYDYSRLFVLLIFALFFFTLSIGRTILLGISYFEKQYTIQRNVIVLGRNEMTVKLIEHLQDFKKTIKINGYFNNENQADFNKEIPFLGAINEAVNYAVNNNVSDIYSTISPETEPAVYQLAEEAEKNFIRFKFVPDFKIFINRRMHVVLEKDILFLSIRRNPLEDHQERLKKRLLDISLSVIVMITILWWLIPIIAFLIKLESPGPIFFKQLRSGRNNKPFLCYKFRTLKINKAADEKQVTKNDARFTTIGKFLRKTNIDELPQFLNVLESTMSVVGPRPHMLRHTEEFGSISENYMARHYFKPGITGWAQINGYRGEIKNNEFLLKRVECDIWYMENWSMWLDMRIILLTALKVIIWDKNAV